MYISLLGALSISQQQILALIAGCRPDSVVRLLPDGADQTGRGGLGRGLFRYWDYPQCHSTCIRTTTWIVLH